MQLFINLECFFFVALSERKVLLLVGHPGVEVDAAARPLLRRARKEQHACMVEASNSSRSSNKAAATRRTIEEEGKDSSSGFLVPTPAAQQQESGAFEGFKFVRSLAEQNSNRAASLESVAGWGCTALVGSATVTGTLTAWAKSRTKAERNLPPGTHVRAAVTAFKALGVASGFTGVATLGVLGVSYVLGIDSVDALRRSLRGATRGAIAATGADTLRAVRR